MTKHFSEVERQYRLVQPVFQGNPTSSNTSNAAGSGRANRRTYRDFVKPALDVVLVILSAPITVPVIALLALLIALDGHNPFYSQMRVGKNGNPFRIWKLRTMVPNADRVLEEYLATDPKARAEWISKQKLQNDPRITKVGWYLRKCSLDELPQFLNVLNGTMSIIGPRPMMLSQENQYVGESYYDLRPGVTGPWQVSERNETDFCERATFDDEYGRTVSFRTDLRILFQTVGVVIKGTGC